MKRLLIMLLAGSQALYGQALTSSNQFPSESQVRELWQWYAQRGDYLVSDIRPKFRKVLSPEDQKLESSLQYEVIITGNTNAFALPGSRTIITSSFLQIIDSMATVMAAAQVFNKPGCLGSYIQYLGDGTRDNTWLVAHHQRPKPVAMAFGYWQLRSDICGGLTEQGFRANQKADDLRELLVYGSIIYLMGHEFCHHKYKDETFKMVTPTQKQQDAARGLDVSHEVTPSEQIPKEERADLFAFKKMIEMDYPPMTAMPVLVFFLGVEGFSPEQTADADHPAAVVRYNDMFEATRQDAALMALIKQHHMEPQWDAFAASVKQLQTSK